jgi:ring-1,2-phenylacetyl-CoA epoxidase subunit PaaC
VRGSVRIDGRPIRERKKDALAFDAGTIPARHNVDVLAEATLASPDSGAAVTGGRRGIHTEHLGYLLAEMQHLARSHPGATW